MDGPEVVTLAKTMLTCEGTQRRQQIQRQRHRSILLQKPIKCTYIFNKRLSCNKTLKLVCDIYPRYFPILLLCFFLPQWQSIALEYKSIWNTGKSPWKNLGKCGLCNPLFCTYLKTTTTIPWNQIFMHSFEKIKILHRKDWRYRMEINTLSLFTESRYLLV